MKTRTLIACILSTAGMALAAIASVLISGIFILPFFACMFLLATYMGKGIKDSQ